MTQTIQGQHHTSSVIWQFTY